MTRTIKYILGIYVMAIMAITGCTKEININQYIKTDISSYTFNVDGAETVTVNINTAPAEWSAEITDGEDWLNIKDISDGSITLSATPNETNSMRHATVTISAGEAKQNIVLSQLFHFELSRFKVFDEFDNLSMNVVLSFNGRYAAGMDYYSVFDWNTFTQTYHYTPIVIDLETGEVTVYDKIENRAVGVYGISDDGKTLLVLELFKANWLFCNNEMTLLPYPDNFSNDCYTEIMNSDASIIYGYGRYENTKNDYRYYPLKYISGTPSLLPIAEKDGHGEYFGNSGGNRTLGCSSDGSVAYGVDQSTNRCVFWNDEGIHYAGDDVYKTVEGVIDMTEYGLGMVETTLYNQPEITFTSKDLMSPNGKWIAMKYYDADIVNYWYDDYYRPVRFNTETGETEVFYELENMAGITCDDNGLLYMMTQVPRSGSDVTDADQTGYVYNPETGELLTCKDYVLNKFGLTVPDIQITRVASNGNMLARTFLNDNGYMKAVQCLIIP